MDPTSGPSLGGSAPRLEPDTMSEHSRSRRSSKESDTMNEADDADVNWASFDGYHEPPDTLRSLSLIHI